jgi:hypothetical protein
MRQESNLPKRIPAGSKYVLESRGGFVRRYLELPDGRKLRLAPRKAAVCSCLATSIVPDAAAREAPTRRRAFERA